MTDVKKTLPNLIEQEADVDLVREMLAFAADRMMELEIATAIASGPGARGPVGSNWRSRS